VGHNLRPSIPAQWPNRPASSVIGPRAIVAAAPAAIQRIQRQQVLDVLQATNPATSAAERTRLLNEARTLVTDVNRLHALEQKVDQLQGALTQIATAPVQTTNLTIHDVNKLKGIANSELRRQR
jgi:hypothetical protein